MTKEKIQARNKELRLAYGRQCPICGARRNQYCVSNTGVVRGRGSPHKPRLSPLTKEST
jgi:hypothetical protein